MTTPGLGKYISGAIMFEETLFQSTSTGKKMTDCLKEQNIVPGIKVGVGGWVFRGGSCCCCCSAACWQHRAAQCCCILAGDAVCVGGLNATSQKPL